MSNTEELQTEISVGGMLSRPRRLFLGFFVLIIVDIIWVGSSEVTKYIYNNEAYEKPFFTTYVKTSMFTIYLLGLCFWPPWREQCTYTQPYMYLEQNEENGFYSEPVRSLSDPQFVPIKRSDRSSGTESDDSSIHSVRFSKMAEVRHMSEADATEALLARLSYQASVRAGEVARRAANKFSVQTIAKIAFTFCILWFLANYTFQVALSETEAGIVTVLSSSSSLFTLLLAALFPSNSFDKFSISKLVAVCLSICGLVLVSLSNINMKSQVPAGSLLALVSAFFYATYLVFLRRKVDHEDKMDIPLFFGFVGLFNLIMLWPLFFLLHYNEWEIFEWPNKEQWMYLFLNGLFGTVLSEVLWLWSCFLTSSLIATIAISLTIPMSMLADVMLKKVNYPYLFYVGSVPMVVSFCVITILAHFDNWDPVLELFKKINWIVFHSFSRSNRRNDDSEQTEALIGINDGDHEA